MYFQSDWRHVAAGLTFALSGTVALAGPGHDHGDEAATATSGSVMPRFTAASELFEMVGVVDGKRLTVYLDHAATNEPVQGAELELEIGGLKVAVQPHAPGEFDAELAQALKPGILPVTATVVTAKGSDLLAGEIDVHADVAMTHTASAVDWNRIVTWGGSVTIALMAIMFGLRLLKRRSAKATVGGAA